MDATQRSEDTPRKRAELAVDCATEEMDEPVTLTTKDVGAGGLFIKTEHPLEVGTRFGCRFDVGDDCPILAECEVVWARPGESDALPAPGMGVRFVALEPGDAVRLQSFITGVELDATAEAPRVTFRIEGLGQTVPGEFRALSDDGMSAVAELPFLKVGSAVQVSIDEAGEGPKAGRIAWLVVEDNEEDEASSPKIRLGIHFDPEAEACLAAGEGIAAPQEPIPLTIRKRSLTEPSPTEPSVPFADPTLPTEPAAPWDISATAAPGPANTGRRRRVRGRQKRSRIPVGQFWMMVREQAAQHPRIAMGVAAGSGVLLVALMAALAFGGSSSPKKKAAPRAKVVATAPVAPTAAPGDPAMPTPPAPPVAAPSGPRTAPPLPGSVTGGREALRSGPGTNADPAKVLGAPGAAGKAQVLADPKPKLKTRIHSYSLGRKFVVKLPTDGKPTRLKHYLLANPNGAVVDAKGAAPLLRPGRYKVKDPRVKMVKVLNRGKAARFIVYYGKGVKAPKIRIMAADDGVNFVIVTKRAPRVAQKRSAKSRRLQASRKRRGTRRLQARRSRPTRKLRPRPRRRSTRRRPAARRRRPAPVADATED